MTQVAVFLMSIQSIYTKYTKGEIAVKKPQKCSCKRAFRAFSAFRRKIEF